MAQKVLSMADREKLLETLENRFKEHPERHKGIKWEDVQAKLSASPAKLWSVFAMEETEGEPDVVGYDKKTSEYLFCDCSAESPKGRRSLCYDNTALEARKANKPLGSAVAMAESMGVTLLTEQEYRGLQKLGVFDIKTSSWVDTPIEIRKLGGAIFCDRRYDQVFMYHNGADSYYGARGFRGMLRV